MSNPKYNQETKEQQRANKQNNRAKVRRGKGYDV